MAPTAVAEISGVEKAAVLMISLGTLKSAEVFKHLDSNEIKKLSAGIIALRSVDPETKAAVLEEFAKARALAARPLATPENFAADILESAIESEHISVSFEDIATLDDASIRAIWDAVDRRTLCLSLKAADNDVKEAVFGSLTDDDASKLKTDIERIGAVKLREIEESQESVATVMRSLRRARRTEANS